MAMIDAKHDGVVAPAGVGRSRRMHVLADKLVADIRQRRLAVGDMYLTTEEAGRMLGVRKATVNDAMKYLAENRILVRQRRRGTFIGPGIQMHQLKKIGTVHVLIPALLYGTPAGMFDAYHIGVSGVLPEASIHFDMVPESEIVRFAKELVRRNAENHEVVAYIAGSCPQDLHRFMIKAGVPCVVIGTNYRGTEVLPSVDVDMERAGRLCVQYFVTKKRQRIAVLQKTIWRPGDNAFVDGVRCELIREGFGMEAMTIRSLSYETSSFEEEVRHLLSGDDAVDSIICHGRNRADVVAGVVRSLGLTVGEDVVIVHDERHWTDDNAAPYPYVVNTCKGRDITAQAGSMLKQLAMGKPLEEANVVFPVELKGVDMSVKEQCEQRIC